MKLAIDEVCALAVMGASVAGLVRVFVAARAPREDPRAARLNAGALADSEKRRPVRRRQQG